MTERPDDLIQVAAGELTALQVLGNALEEAGIQSRVVGGELTAGLGTALPGSVELWVHRNDVAAAEKVIAGHRPHAPHTHGHPTSDPKPDRTSTPQSHKLPHQP